jgi:hypothetical protein
MRLFARASEEAGDKTAMVHRHPDALIKRSGVIDIHRDRANEVFALGMRRDIYEIMSRRPMTVSSS